MAFISLFMSKTVCKMALIIPLPVTMTFDPLQTVSGLSHGACFGQWDISKCEPRRNLQSTCASKHRRALTSLPAPGRWERPAITGYQPSPRWSQRPKRAELKCQLTQFWPTEKWTNQDLPGGPVVKAPYFHHRGASSILGWGTRSCMPGGIAKKDFFLSK